MFGKNDLRYAHNYLHNAIAVMIQSNNLVHAVQKANTKILGALYFGHVSYLAELKFIQNTMCINEPFYLKEHGFDYTYHQNKPIRYEYELNMIKTTVAKAKELIRKAQNNYIKVEITAK